MHVVLSCQHTLEKIIETFTRCIFVYYVKFRSANQINDKNLRFSSQSQITNGHFYYHHFNFLSYLHANGML